MTLIVSPETEARLSVIAARRGILPEAPLDLLVDGALDDKAWVVRTPVDTGTDRPLPVYDPAALVAVLDSFNTGDAEEQRRTLEQRRTALNRHRSRA